MIGKERLSPAAMSGTWMSYSYLPLAILRAPIEARPSSHRRHAASADEWAYPTPPAGDIIARVLAPDERAARKRVRAEQALPRRRHASHACAHARFIVR
jgi:hypothetical protein